MHEQKYLAYRQNPQGIWQEWLPHQDAWGWWYFSGELQDEKGNRYFLHYTLVSQALRNPYSFAEIVSLHSFKDDKRIYIQSKAGEGEALATEQLLQFQKNKIEIINKKPFTAKIKIDITELKLELKINATKKFAWHGDNGLCQIGGKTGILPQQGIYGSFTNITFKGSMQLSGKNLQVKGKLWFDRQYGQFIKKEWNWLAIQLIDGRELMLYTFPDKQYDFGTLVEKSGEVRILEDYNIEYKDEKWVVNIEYLQMSMFVLPISTNQWNKPPHQRPYWEGLSDVFDQEQKKIGIAVTEMT